MKPKIVSINWHGCARVFKQAMPLKANGWDMTLIANTHVPHLGGFKRKLDYHDPGTLKDAIKLFSDRDIFHVHNEPSWMVSLIRQTHPKARIIYDVHDSNYFRTLGGFNWYEEDVALQLCDAYVFVCETAKERSPRDKTKPAIVIPSANPRAVHNFGPWNSWGGLVCEGGHINPWDTDPGNSWRDYTQLYSLLKDKRQVFAYCAGFTKGNEKIDNYYIALGCKIGSMTHGEMLSSLGAHDWSLVGNITNHLVWKITMPNKFWDSMAAGVPVAVFECLEAKKLAEEYDVGIWCETPDDLLERWDEHRGKRANVFKYRHEFAEMETYIPRLEGLYATL